MSSLHSFNNALRTSAVVFGMMGLFFDSTRPVHSFVVEGSKARRSPQHLLAVVEDDGGDFASYYEEQVQEGRALANEFQQELQARKSLSSTASMADIDSTSGEGMSLSSTLLCGHEEQASKRNPMDDDVSTTTQAESTENAAARGSSKSPGFFANSKRYVYSDGTRMRSSAVPLPPKPKYSSTTQLGTTASFAVVVLFMRFFWLQALALGGLMCFYLFLAATTTPNNGGGVEWLGASLGNTSMENWFSAAINGGVTTNQMGAEDTAMM